MAALWLRSALTGRSPSGTCSREDLEIRLTLRYPAIDYHEKLWRVAISDDGSMISTGSESGRVRVCDAGSGRLLHEFRAQESDVNGVAFLDDRTLVSTGDGSRNQGSRNSALMVWDTGLQDVPAVGGEVTTLAVGDEGRVQHYHDVGHRSSGSSARTAGCTRRHGGSGRPRAVGPRCGPIWAAATELGRGASQTRAPGTR